MFVKKKERELRALIMEMSERARGEGGAALQKEERIRQLQGLLREARESEARTERVARELREQVREWREKAREHEEEAGFMKAQAIKDKRHNKLLKTAIIRMQEVGMGGYCPKCRAEKPVEEALQEELDKNPFFITESKTINDQQSIKEHSIEKSF